MLEQVELNVLRTFAVGHGRTGKLNCRHDGNMPIVPGPAKAAKQDRPKRACCNPASGPKLSADYPRAFRGGNAHYARRGCGDLPWKENTQLDPQASSLVCQARRCLDPLVSCQQYRVEAESGIGRQPGHDQLYVWVNHWLDSYLLDPERYQKQHPIAALTP